MNKPLFSVFDTPHKESMDHMSSSFSTDQYELLFQENSLTELKKSIGELVEGTILKFKSEGAWSMHELMAYLLEKAGPSDVYLATWTISEDPVRTIFQLKNIGLINSLHCLLDYRISTKAGDAFQLLKGIADRLKLVKCHAKVLVLLNDDWGISVVASANFSKNRRIEAGTIFIDRQAALYDKEWMTKIIEADETN